MYKLLNKGIGLRWFNTAGFEMIIPGGAHILVDPWLDSATIYPFPLEQVERVDYILLSHVHFDHAQNLEHILEKFPKAKLLMGDLSIQALCREQHISLTNIYRVRNGDEYQFDDVNIKVFGGRHTENAKGVYLPKEWNSARDSLDAETGWFGSLELQQFLLTANDGSSILIWGGQTTADQKYRLQHLHPDLAILHLSPKQDPNVFGEMVQYIAPKVVIPHHYDMTRSLFDEKPELLNVMLSEEQLEQYTVDGKFNDEAFISAFGEALQQWCPTATMLQIKHHKWYRFGLAYSEEHQD